MFRLRAWKWLLVIAVVVGAGGRSVSAADDHGGHHPHIGESEQDAKAAIVPQDAAGFKTDLAVYSFLVFLVLTGILFFAAFKPISEKLVAREDAIRKNIEDAKAEREKAEELRKDYQGQLEAADDKAKEIVAEANRDAERLRADKLAEADKEAEDRLDRALTEIKRAKDSALEELFSASAQRVADATEHVLGRAVNDDDQSRLIDEALGQFSQQG